jgi:hypothetical protein
VFVIVDRVTEQRYVPAKSADKSTIRLLLAERQQEPLPTILRDSAYDSLTEDGQIERE